MGGGSFRDTPWVRDPPLISDTGSIQTQAYKCNKCNKYKYIHTHTYIHTYIHTYTHTHIHTYIHTYIHTCIHTYIHTYIHGFTCVFMPCVCLMLHKDAEADIILLISPWKYIPRSRVSHTYLNTHAHTCPESCTNKTPVGGFHGNRMKPCESFGVLPCTHRGVSERSL